VEAQEGRDASASPWAAMDDDPPWLYVRDFGCPKSRGAAEADGGNGAFNSTKGDKKRVAQVTQEHVFDREALGGDITWIGEALFVRK